MIAFTDERLAVEDPGVGGRPDLGAQAGRWVAIRDGRVLHDAASAGEFGRWLREHRQRADERFCVLGAHDQPATEHGLM